MSKCIDLTGRKFGKLTVVERAKNSKGGKSRWLCSCDCGKEKIVLGDSLRNGITSSCGCKYFESNKGRNKTHGQTKTRLHRIWSSMKQRCNYPNARCFELYGGRGITVCDEWSNSFEAFRDWALANGYAEGLTIDRINVNGNYEPSNCRWATFKEQENNRTNNRKVTYKGKEYTLSKLAEELHISSATLAWRLNHGWNEDHLAITPAFNNKVRRFLK